MTTLTPILTERWALRGLGFLVVQAFQEHVG